MQHCVLFLHYHSTGLILTTKTLRNVCFIHLLLLQFGGTFIILVSVNTYAVNKIPSVASPEVNKIKKCSLSCYQESAKSSILKPV